MQLLFGTEPEPLPQVTQIDPALESSNQDIEPENPDELVRADRSSPPHLDAHFSSIIQNIDSLNLECGYTWVTQKDAWQLLRKGWSEESFRKIYLPDVFIWAPHKCDDVTLKCPRGHTLKSKGTFDKPKARRVLDLNKSFYLMQWRYECQTCSTENVRRVASEQEPCQVTWGSGHKVILDQLPPPLRKQFQIFLTHRSAVTFDVALLTRQCFSGGIGPKNLHDFLQERYKKTFADLEETVLETFCHLEKKGTLAHLRQKITPSTFEDRDRYNGYIPSAGYLKFIFCELEENIERHVVKYMSTLSMEVGKFDHSFKVNARLHCYGGRPYCTALYTGVNEDESIRGMRLCVSKSMIHVKDMLEGIERSTRRYGLPPTRLIYTDSARVEEPLFAEIFPGVRATLRNDAITPPAQAESGSRLLPADPFAGLAPFALPRGVNVQVLNTREAIDDACTGILLRAQQLKRHGDTLVVGFDAEWPFTWEHEQPITGKVAVIQIAYQFESEKSIIVAQVRLLLLSGGTSSD